MCPLQPWTIPTTACSSPWYKAQITDGPEGHMDTDDTLLHASPCQMQHSGFGKWKGEDGCTDRLNCMNPPHRGQQRDPQVSSSLPSSDLASALLPHFCTGWETGVCRGEDRREGKDRLCQKYLHTDTGTHRCRICAALARVLLARGLLIVGAADGAKHLLLCTPLCSGGTG